MSSKFLMGSTPVDKVLLGTLVADQVAAGAELVFTNCPKLPAPSSISVTPGNAEATVTWAEVSGASDYSLQYRAAGSLEWVEPAAAPAASLSQIDGGSFTWSGSGTLADPYVTTYLRSGVPSIRGGSPGNWTSSNRPAWQVSGSGTFKYTISGMSSADSDADHGLYQSSDSGATWTLAHLFSFSSSLLQTASFSVADGDIIEQRGNGASYQSDTWVENPTVWLE